MNSLKRNICRFVFAAIFSTACSLTILGFDLLQPNKRVEGSAGRRNPGVHEVSMKRGNHYLFSIVPRTLGGPEVKVRDPEGRESKWFKLGPMRVVNFTANSTGKYQFAVRGSGPMSGGSYTIVYSPDNAPSAYRNAPALKPGVRYAGRFELKGDDDRYSFTAKKGIKYSLDVGLISAADAIVEIRYSRGGNWRRPIRGMTVLRRNKRTSKITFTAAYSQRYYVLVKPAGKTYETSTVGRYRFKLTGDDYPNSHAYADGGTGPATYNGNIDYEGDEDWFKMGAHVQVNYRIEAAAKTLRGIRVQLFSVVGSRVTQIWSSDGLGRAVISWRGVRRRPFNGRLATVTTTDAGKVVEVRGPVYVKVSARNGKSLGTYQLKLTQKSDSILDMPDKISSGRRD